MKNIFFLILVLPLFVFSQTRKEALTRQVLQFSAAGVKPDSRIQYRNICGQEYLPMLAWVESNFDDADLPEGIFQGSRSGNVISLYVRRDLLDTRLSIPGVTYFEWARPAYPMLDKAVHDARVDSVHMGWNLPQPFTGKDVLIGITDWGFDYTQPMFYDTALQHTRIVKAWDQFRNAGPAPSGYLYGTEFVGETELLTAQCDTSNIYDYATHGSHVAGIAGGSGAGTIYRGVAYEAGFLFTTFLVDAAAVLDAYNWMKDYSESSGKRLVINQSWGLYYMGNLDGTSLLSQAIDTMSAHGVVFVSSAGNNGDADFHLKYDASANDTLRTVVGFDTYSYYPTMWGQCVTMWGTPGHAFETKLQVLNSSGTVLGETSFFMTDTISSYIDDTLFVGSDTILYNIAADSANPLNQRPFMQLRVANRNTSYKIALQIHSDTATVHLWNVIELSNGVGNWGLPFLASFTGFTAGDPYYGVGEPACAHSAIAVAAHNSEYYHPVNGSLLGGNIAYFSSYGPLIDGTIKPDISAPGYGVCSSISSFTTQYISPTSVVESVGFGGRTYRFVKFSGTSMSSPMVTGIVALMLEADPNLTPAQIMAILKETSREDDRTGDLPETGDTRWGWGKADALHAIYAVLGVEGIHESASGVKATIYPNPATDYIQILSPDGRCGSEVSIFSADGRLVKQSIMGSDYQVDVSFLQAGLYFLHFDVEQKPVVLPFVVGD